MNLCFFLLGVIFVWQLLGMDSDDIDIALDDMLGREFCEKITEYLSSIGEGTTVAAVIAS